jgi:hypothetical protein
MTTGNPLHLQEEGVANSSSELYRRKPHTPSAAYMASYEKARASNTYTPPDNRDEDDVNPG